MTSREAFDGDLSAIGGPSVTVIDLAHQYFRGMPVSPNHPDFDLALKRRHGDVVRPDGGSSANEIVILGGHVGTHVDALAHISHEGALHGGVATSDAQGHLGFSSHDADEIGVFVGRGVLLDVARVAGVDVLPAAYEVTARDLEAAQDLAGTEVRPGDAVLIRTGWSAHWNTPLFNGQAAGAPGPGAGAADWIADRGVRFAGAETIAFEAIHPETGHTHLPVHRRLLVEAGVFIIETMNLAAFPSDASAEFVFVLAPLRFTGATGAPVRPLALVRRS